MSGSLLPLILNYSSYVQLTITVYLHRLFSLQRTHVLEVTRQILVCLCISYVYHSEKNVSSALSCCNCDDILFWARTGLFIGIWFSGWCAKILFLIHIDSFLLKFLIMILEAFNIDRLRFQCWNPHATFQLNPFISLIQAQRILCKSFTRTCKQ